MSKLEIEEKNRAEHKLWHSFVPFNVADKTSKDSEKWITITTCKFCNYIRIVTKWWNK